MMVQKGQHVICFGCVFSIMMGEKNKKKERKKEKKFTFGKGSSAQVQLIGVVPQKPNTSTLCFFFDWCGALCLQWDLPFPSIGF